MVEGINEIAVLVTTLLAIAVGSVWYSPVLFGKQWMAAVGLTEADMEKAKNDMPKLLALGALANLVTIYTVAYMVVIAESASVSVFSMGVWLIILIGSIIAVGVIWERKSLSYFLINGGYAAVVVIGGMHILAFWPW